MLVDEYKQFDQFTVSEPKPSVAHVEINRARTYNSFDANTWSQYRELFTKLDQDESVKAIILTGAGKNFCSGLDLKDAAKQFGSMGKDQPALRQHIVEFQEAIGTPARISTPTIALIHGLSIGLALDITGAVSIRVVTKDAKLSVREIAIGIIADIGSLQRLPKVFNNQSKINELALTGGFWSWKDASDSGFVSYVEEDKAAGYARCLDIAEKIVQHERWCIKGTKTAIAQMNEVGVKEGLKYVADYNAENIDTKMMIQGLKRILKLQKTQLVCCCLIFIHFIIIVFWPWIIIVIKIGCSRSVDRNIFSFVCLDGEACR